MFGIKDCEGQCLHRFMKSFERGLRGRPVPTRWDAKQPCGPTSCSEFAGR